MIANQFVTIAGAEAQLVGLIAVLGAGLGLFALVQHSLRDERLILLIGVSCAIVTCLWGLFFTPEVDFGPRPTAFYEKLGGSASADYLAHLVSDLDQTIVVNDDAIRSRRGAAGLTLGVIGLTILAWLLVLAIS